MLGQNPPSICLQQIAALYARKQMKPFRLMSKAELKNALVRSIVLEYQNERVSGAMSWGHDAPKSMFIARKNRIRLAELYSRKYEPVSKLLFQKKLPSGNEWKGTKVLVSNSVYAWVNEVWTHIGCTVPYGHCRGI